MLGVVARTGIVQDEDPRPVDVEPVAPIDSEQPHSVVSETLADAQVPRGVAVRVMSVLGK
jgi:hypothetical protein